MWFRYDRYQLEIWNRIKMGLVTKLSILIFTLIAFQGVCAWPSFNIFRWKNLGYEINKAADDAEKDIRKDMLSVKNSIWKDTSKIVKKMRDMQMVIECVVEKQQEYLMTTDEISVKAMECVEEIRTEVNGIDVEEYGPRELATMRNTFKSNIKACRNKAKTSFKTTEKEFSRDATVCKSDASLRSAHEFSYQ